MTEWQILDSNDFSDNPADEQESGSWASRWGWGVLIGGIVAFLLVAGFTTLREQRAEGRAAIREDLAAVIFEEESAQFLGNVGQAVNFMWLTAPDDWQYAYQQTFVRRDDRPAPGSVQLKEVDFDGRCAVVDVSVAGSEQVRAYCLDGDRWRRAPVPAEAWGDTQETLQIAANIQLRFWPRDREFAQTLAQDARQLLAELAQWPQNSGAESDLEIIIEPQDLQPTLIAQEEQRIVFNSPKLTANNGFLSGAELARLILAEALIRRTRSFAAAAGSSLPGKDNILTAGQTVVAMHAVLPPIARAKLLASWQTDLSRRWLSPFLATNNPDFAHQAKFSAYLTVDYIYRAYGPMAVGDVLSQLTQTGSWDRLFQTTLKRSTLALETEAVADVEKRLNTTLERTPNGALVSPNLPFQTNLLRADTLPTGGSRIYTSILDRLEPLVIDIPPHVNPQTPDGTALPAGCIPFGSTMNIDGEWLEAPWRLQAGQITVPEITPLSIGPAPENTLAILVDDEPSAEQATLVNDVLLSSQANSVTTPTSRILSVVLENGLVRRLGVLNRDVRVFALPVTAGDPMRLLFKLDLSHCDRSWFVLYESTQGVIKQWISPADTQQWLWRPDSQDILYFTPHSGGRGYNIYKNGSTLAPKLVSQSFGVFTYLGWHINLARPINALGWFETTYIGVGSLSTDSLERLHSYFQPVRALQLSPTGEWLAYLAGGDGALIPARQLGLLNLNTQKDVVITKVEAGQSVAFPTWSAYLESPLLAALTGPVGDDNRLRPKRLLLVSPQRPDEYTVAVEVWDGEELGAPVFCADGTMLYRVKKGEQYHLLRQSPGHSPETLFTQNRLFRPVACR
jgi:hypothetical protein